MAVALTPTVGVQMPIVLLVWVAVRALRPRWEFNVLVGMAWTWVTNVFTAPPVYYVFYLTGRLMLGESGNAGGYERFSAVLAHTLAREASWLEKLWLSTTGLFESFGVPMFVGSIPWAIVGAWLSYRWSLRLLLRLRERREQRRRERVVITGTPLDAGARETACGRSSSPPDSRPSA